MKERDEIEELFSSAFSDFEKIPPVDLKAEIDRRIAGTNSKKSKIFRIVWIMSSLIMILLFLWMEFKSYFSDELHGRENNNYLLIDNRESEKTESYPYEMTKSKKYDFKSKENSKNEKEFNNARLPYKSVNRPLIVKRKNNLLKKDVKSYGSGRRIFSRKSPGRLEMKANKGIYDIIDDGGYNSALIQVTFNQKSDSVNWDLDKTVIEKMEDSQSKLAEGASEGLSNSCNNVNIVDSVITMPIQSQETISSSAWSYSLFAGATYGFSSLRQEVGSGYKMKEKPGVNLSVETDYKFNNRYGLGCGIDLNLRKDVFYEEIYEYPVSVYSEDSVQYIYDPVVTDSIIDTVLIAIYNYFYSSPTLNEYQEIINHFSIGIPLYFNVTVFANARWSMNLNSGIRFSYVSNKISSNHYNLPVPNFIAFGLRGSLRPQILYTMDNGIGIGGYLNIGYDLIPAIQWSGIVRNRIDIGTGILMRFRF